MLQKVVDFIKASRPAQFAVVFFAGVILSAIFYPTKEIKESLQKTYQQQITTLQNQWADKLETQLNEYHSLSEEYYSYKTQTDAKVNDLTTQVSSLKNHTKTVVVKVVHPDGTLEEHDTTESDTDQTQQLSEQMQQEWQQKTDDAVKTATQQLQQQVTTLQQKLASQTTTNQQTNSTVTQSKTETINPKYLTLDVGLMNNMDYYGHATYNFWGPFIIGGQVQFGKTNAGGAGFGLRF
jgi:hypothetical protein